MKTQIGIAICSLNQTGDSFQVLPAGSFRAADGRPQNLKGWELINPDALLTKLAQRKNDVLIDYEHQILNAVTNGQPAPAAGWVKPNGFEWRPEHGLFARPQWTARASQMIADGEYRFISPVFRFSPTSGEITDLLHIGLTNDPAIDGMQGVAAAASRMNGDPIPMNPELLKLLKLPENATEEDAIAALKTQQQSATQGADASAAAIAELASMMKQFVQQQTLNERENLIAANNKKFTGAMKEWAKTAPIEALRAYINSAPDIDALSKSQTDGKEPENGKDTTLTADEIALCKQMGLTHEEYLKERK